MIVAVRLVPTAPPGPEGLEDLLLANCPSAGVDLDVFRGHEMVEGLNVEPEVGKEPFALDPEDLFDCRCWVRWLAHALPSLHESIGPQRP